MKAIRTIRYGDRMVPIIERHWKTSGGKPPYPKTYALKPGQHWKDAPLTMDQWEHYVMLDETVISYATDATTEVKAIPVGAAIARELIEEGAAQAVWTECWGRGTVLVGPDLICVERAGALGLLLNQLRSANGNRWSGLPDAVALFNDGHIAFREGKRAKNDSLQPQQHEFARVAEKILGEKLDLAVVEWAYAEQCLTN